MNYWTLSKKNIFVAAHRGWCETYPENTMLAFKKAIEVGVDQIETDLRMSSDGEIVLIHDDTVDRTTDGTGLVEEKTLSELKALDAGVKKGEKFKGEKIPTFIELMELVKDHPTLTLDLELNEYPTGYYGDKAYEICDKIIEIVEKYNFGDRIVLNSFSGKLNEYVFKKYGKKYRQHVFYPESCLGETTIDPYSYAYCCCMFSDNANGEFAEMDAKGVQPWGGASIKDDETVTKAIKDGVYLITCNNPQTVLALLKEKGYHK